MLRCFGNPAIIIALWNFAIETVTLERRKDRQHWTHHISHAGSKIDEAAERVEREAEQFIRYLNDEVVPAIRTQSTRALRTAAEKMQDFADYMEKHKKPE